MPHLLEVMMPYTGELALLLRVFLGVTLMLHGYPKLSKQHLDETTKRLGIPPAAALLGTMIEFFGGLLLLVGFIVPVVGAVEAIYFGNIVAFKRAKQKAVYVGRGVPNFEMEVFFVMVSLALVFLGAGVLSLDGLLGL